MEIGGNEFAVVPCEFASINMCTVLIEDVKAHVEIGENIRVRVAALSDFGLSERSQIAERLFAFRPLAPTLSSDASVTDAVTVGLKWTDNSN